MGHGKILIIGGGVIGLSIAEAFSRRGIKPIVLEKGDFGREASWAGAGTLSPKSALLAGGAKADLARFSLRLYDRWMELLKQESGIDPGYHATPAWEVAYDEQEAEGLLDVLKRYRELDVPAEWKSGDEARGEESDLSPEIVAAIQLPAAAQVRPPWLMRALRGVLDKRGVEMRDQTAVAAFVVQGGRVHGVKTAYETITADAVVLAAGAWSGPLTEKLGFKVPVKPLRGQVALFASDRLSLRSVLFTPQTVVVPRADGRYHVSSAPEDVGYNKNTTLQGMEKIEAGAYRAVPGLRLARMESRWAGLMPGTPDGLPFLGPVPGIEGLFLACGHGDQGHLLAPATGLLLDQAVRGEECDIALDPFLPSRIPAAPEA